MNTALTRQCPEHRTALAPCPQTHQQCVRAEASPWGLTPSVGLCNGDLKAPTSNQAAKLAAQSAEWTGNVCPSSFQGVEVTVPEQSSVLALGEAQQQSSPQLPSLGPGRNHQLPRFRQCLLPCQLVLSSGKEMLQPCSLTAPPFSKSILYAGPGALG